MIEIGKVLTLNNNKEYIVANVMDINRIKYVYLLSNFKPLEIIIATVKEENGEVVFEEVKSNDELDYVLSKMILTEDEEEVDE